MIDYWDLPLLMFPFLQFVSHWYDFLQHHFKHYSDVNGLINRLHDDLNDPKELTSAFKQSDETFIKYLTKTPPLSCKNSDIYYGW